MESNNPCNPLFGLLTPSKRCVKIVGTIKSPMPNDNAAETMNRSLRVHWTYESTRRPEAITLAKRKVVTPPRTGSGTDKRNKLEYSHHEK